MNSNTLQQLLHSPDTGHSTRRHLQPNDRVLTPKRARHPISSPVTGEPAGARSLRRSRTRPGSTSADPPAAAGQSLPEETPAGLIRLRGQGRPQAVAAAIAQRPLMPEGRPRNLRGASPRCGVDTASGRVPRGVFDVDLAGAVWSLNALPKRGYRSAARQLDPTPLPRNVTRPPQPSADPHSCRKTPKTWVNHGLILNGSRDEPSDLGFCSPDWTRTSNRPTYRSVCWRRTSWTTAARSPALGGAGLMSAGSARLLV